ncbi:sigma-70 family RNA polymerase sigma factor [bacterium]|nr:sigma-70 family RNA polymerase sigma factor [bacterium]
MTDAALIERYLNGDINAFNTLIWRWEKPIYNFVLRTIGNRELAKDLCQSVFIRMYKQLKTLKDPEKFSSWVYRIALNLCKDEFKKKRIRRLVSFDALTDEDTNQNRVKWQFQDRSARSPEDLMQHQQVESIIKNALKKIPDEQRVVIVMKQYQGLKFTEIADILNEPINTVKSRLYYGLRAMKKVLEESNLSKEVLLHEM